VRPSDRPSGALTAPPERPVPQLAIPAGAPVGADGAVGAFRCGAVPPESDSGAPESEPERQNPLYRN